MAFYSISTRVSHYQSPIWGAAEYFALMAIVLMHEFGHSMACRSVGGQADQIVLWPLGGVAYVAPPQRPGATLWSIAAGPLVNVALAPLLFGLLWFAGFSGWNERMPDLYEFIDTIVMINLGLLIFNLLPIYPMDGGQILRSLLWYPFGRARSLLIATVIGLIGGVALIGYLLTRPSLRQGDMLWFGAIGFFLLSNCWRALQHARDLQKLERIPRRAGFACPSCHSAPLAGPYWRCRSCSQPFDPFATNAICPHCATASEVTVCPDCGVAKPLRSWDKSIVEV